MKIQNDDIMVCTGKDFADSLSVSALGNPILLVKDELTQEQKKFMRSLPGNFYYIIGGESSNIGVESTIVDCTVNPPIILRPGGITLEMLREVDSSIEID